MEQITLIKRNGSQINLFSKEPFCTVSSAVQNVTLMGDDNVQLNIRSAQFMDFAKGDKILVNGEEYSIRTKVTREILSESNYSYDPIFYGVMYELMKSQYRNTDANGKSNKSTFDLTYTLCEFMKVVIYNTNRDYPGLWVFDEESCPDTEPKTFQFSRQNCLQVVQTVCKDYKFDFRIDQKDGVRILRVGKFGEKINPPGGNQFFEWGKGNGLYRLKEQKVDDKSIITRLWVEGGTTNIRSEYRDYSDRLQLPYPKRLNQREHTLSDGTVIPAQSEYIGIDNDNDRYIEDAALRDEIGSDEDTGHYDDVFPQRTGSVTALGTDLYSFVDSTMDFDLNEKDSEGTKYLIGGVTAKLTFITGRLASQQFELKEKGGYDHSTKTFKIIKYTDERGAEFPSPDSEAFRFQVGDKYKITDINLPKSYEDNAEEDLWYAGYDEFKDRKQARAQYVLTFDRPYFLNALPDDSATSVFKCGDYVPVKDVRYNIEKNIRIQKLSRNLLLDHDYTLTLSDTTTISIQTQTVLDVMEHNIIIDNNRLRDLNKARRGWRTTEELRNMVYDTDGYFDVENIRPNSIDTNMLTVGSKSQQFILIDTILQANVNGLPNRFDATAGKLAHLSLSDTEIKIWNMASASVTLSETGGYYVFAKCSKNSDSGIYYITQEQLKVEPTEDPNNYYFQVGIIGTLHSDDNFRDFITTYGFTRINGNTITTGRIVTSDGECYLDLDGNKFRIGDSSSSIDWNVTAQKQLTLFNVNVLSRSGDMSNIGVYRGEYNSTYIYYTGDEVTYLANGITSFYRRIGTANTRGIAPTNGTYWAVIAQGSQGSSGNWVSYVFKQSTTTPTTPTGTATIPSGWSDVPTTTGKWWMSKATINGVTGLAGTWSAPVQVTAEDGTDGAYTDFKYRVNTSSTTAPALATTSRNPANWSDTPPALTTGQYLWMTQATIKADDTLDGTWSAPVRISGEKGGDGTNGTNGTDGAYFEYRYAKNGSTSTAPSLSTTTASPSGWTTTVPTVGTLEYLWCTVAKKSAAGALLQNWSTPVRIKGYDGIDGANGKDGDKGDKGDSPVLVFRGVYDSTKSYYGNSNRIDCVKYNGVYYVARIDAGTFSNVTPTTTSKWNAFGAQFDSIATDLLLAENANVANWIFSGGMLKSQNGAAFLNGVNGSVKFANGNFLVDESGNVTVKGDFVGKISTSKNGNRIEISAENNSIIMYNNVNGSDYKVLEIGWDDAGFGIMRPKIEMLELTSSAGVMASLIISPFEMGYYRYGDKNSPFFEITGGWSSKKIKIGSLALPTSSSGLSSGQLWRDGSTLKIVT